MCLVADWIVNFFGLRPRYVSHFRDGQKLYTVPQPILMDLGLSWRRGGGGGITYVQGEIQTDDIRPGKEVVEVDIFCPILQNWG